MYISEATHEALCDAGLFTVCVFLGMGLIALAIDWITRRREIICLRIKIIAMPVIYALEDAIVWAVCLAMRIKKAAQRVRDKRRKALAMRVFDKPVRWSVK
jgi:uncharacterized membrane protein